MNNIPLNLCCSPGFSNDDDDDPEPGNDRASGGDDARVPGQVSLPSSDRYTISELSQLDFDFDVDFDA